MEMRLTLHYKHWRGGTDFQKLRFTEDDLLEWANRQIKEVNEGNEAEDVYIDALIA